MNEYLVGVEVFGRPPNYDPRIDPIVRVQARKLRQRLAAYYERDGGQDSILIEVPSGGYAARFRRRAAAFSESALAGAPEASGVADARERETRRALRSYRSPIWPETPVRTISVTASPKS